MMMMMMYLLVVGSWLLYLLVLGCWFLVGTVGTDAPVDPNVFEVEILYSPSLGSLKPCCNHAGCHRLKKRICFFRHPKKRWWTVVFKGEISVETAFPGCNRGK